MVETRTRRQQTRPNGLEKHKKRKTKELGQLGGTRQDSALAALPDLLPIGRRTPARGGPAMGYSHAANHQKTKHSNRIIRKMKKERTLLVEGRPAPPLGSVLGEQVGHLELLKQFRF